MEELELRLGHFFFFLRECKTALRADTRSPEPTGSKFRHAPQMALLLTGVLLYAATKGCRTSYRLRAPERTQPICELSQCVLFIFLSSRNTHKKKEEEEEARLSEVTPVMRRDPTQPEEASRCRSAATHPPGGGGPADSPLYFWRRFQAVNKRSADKSFFKSSFFFFSPSAGAP